MIRTVLCYLLFLLFALAYAVLTPPGEAPDEMPHLQYVDFLLHERRLPHRLHDNIYQDHHPPLYYAAAAVALRLGQRLDPRGALDLPGPYRVRVDLSEPALDRGKLDSGLQAIPEALRGELARKANLRERHFAITRGQFVVVRLLSVLLALATLALVHRTVRLCVPDSTPVAAAALAFVAFLPQFQFIGGMINCDIMAIFTGNLLLHVLAVGLVRGTLLRLGTALVVGFCLALCLLAKMSGVAMIAPVLVAFALTVRLAGVVRVAAPLGLALAIAAVGGGWWYALNYTRYGDPFMVAAQAATMGEQIHQPPLTSHYFAAYLFDTVRSFFGQLGPFSIPIADWSFYLYVALLGLALTGLALRLAPRRKIELAPGGGAALIVLAVGLLATWLVVFRGNLTFYSSQGRYLYPGLAAVAAAMGLGLVEALRPGRVLRLVGFLLLLAIAVHVFWFRFLPEYYPLRARALRPLAVRYENAGHPHLSPALVEGNPSDAWGGFGANRSPDGRTARGARVAMHFDGLPPADPLRVRIRFGEYFERPEPWRFPVQSLHLNGHVVAGALAVTSRPRELVFPVPGYPGGGNAVDLVLTPLPDTGPFATVSEVWVERFPVKPRGLAVATQAVRGRALPLELTVENLDPGTPARCRLQADLVASGQVFPLGAPVRVELAPGETRAVRIRPEVPPEVPPGQLRLRASLGLEDAAPFVDINPCISTASAGKIEPDRNAFGRYRLMSAPTAETGDRPGESRRLAVRFPVPAAPPGRYRLMTDARFDEAGASLEVAIRREGRVHATVRRDTERPPDPCGSRAEVELAFDWPGGPGEIVLEGKGVLGVDRVRLVPDRVPGLDRITFPHEPALDVR